MKYDIIVMGGGVAGTAAAVAAAREGSRVLILEKCGYLGGSATNSFVNPLMSYHYKTKDGTLSPINLGIFQEIIRRLDELHGMHENRHVFNMELLKLVLDRMVIEQEIAVLFHSYLIDAAVEGGRIKSVTVANKSGKMTFEADYFIDATGDADLAAMTNCSYKLGREGDHLCQPMTLCFWVGDVDVETFFPHRESISGLYQELQKKGLIGNPRENVLTFLHICGSIIHFNSTRVVKLSPVDAWDLSHAEMELREQTLELFNYMKENAPGFEKSVLLISAPQAGVRESRMIDGETTISVEDILQCVKFEDAIACGNYCVDIHSPDGTGTDIRTIKEHDYYTIPYRALIPKSKSNLLVAGRCISSDHEAQSAYRIMPICCCIGESAGIAAGLAARDGIDVRDVDIHELQERIEKHGGKYR